MAPTRYEQGCHNLRQYLREAKLPEMICTRFCPHLNNPDVFMGTSHLFLLSPRPDTTRKLRLVLHILPSVINMKIASFIIKIPNRQLPGAHDTAYDRPACICVPASSFDIPFDPPRGIYDIDTMSSWMNLPLRTAERIMSLVWPDETCGYIITPCHKRPIDLDRDTDLYKSYFYKKSRDVDHNNTHESLYKMIIMQLIPWALTKKDLDDFMRVSQFPKFSTIHSENVEKPPMYSRVHKIWAKLWDICSSKKCPYFVVSVYDCWIFGVFVKGWTTALISERIRPSTEKPTVMQWLIFWLATSMKFPGGWETPALIRFGHPDISRISNVALRVFSEDVKNEVLQSNEEWMDEHHKEFTDEDSQRTVQISGLENTWLTKFRR